MKIFIGCSGSDNMPEKYMANCQKLISVLFENNHDLVFGANKQGLMGLSYNLAKKNKREVIGICPEAYQKDFKELECDLELITKTIGNRTDKLIELSDIIIFLPGGIGTVYELMTAIEGKRSGEFDKPILIYNCYGYYDKLIEFLDEIYNQNISSPSVKDCYHISNDLEDALNFLNKTL